MASKAFIDLDGLLHYDEKLLERLANYVTLAGTQTITGTKSFTSNLTIAKSGPILSQKNTSVETTVYPASGQQDTRMNFYDKNGHNLCSVLHRIEPTKSAAYLRAFNFNRTDSENAWTDLAVGYDNAGNIFTAAPTPAVADNSTKIATTAWCRTATGNFACNAATASKATGDSNGRNISTGYMWRGSYERIEGTSSAKKDLNDYKNPGFYNVKTINTLNCPEGIGIDAVLLNYPWNQGNYLTQEITESAASTDCRRWIRKLNGSTWSTWKQVEMDIGAVSNAEIDTLFA